MAARCIQWREPRSASVAKQIEAECNECNEGNEGNEDNEGNEGNESKGR